MFYVGIDIAKKTHEIGILDEHGEKTAKSFSITNSEQGFTKLMGRLDKAGVGAENCSIGMEATGHYWLALYSHLLEAGFAVFVINPIQTDAFRNVGTVRAAKTDSIDSFLIADLIRFGRFSATHLAEESMVALKQLVRHRIQIIKQRTALKNRLTAVLDMVFPEYPKLFADIYGQGSKEFLASWPTPEEISHVTTKRIAALLKKASGNKLGETKAKEIKEMAAASFGINFATEALSFEIKQMIGLINFIDEQLKPLEAQIAKTLKQTNTYLESIPGIGPVFASIIVAEIGDITRFSAPSQIIAFAGMDVPANQSGEFTGTKKHMSKRGSPSLRWALLQGADKVRVWDPYFREYYERLIARGKHHYVALAAVARKLINVVFVLLNEQRAYKPLPPGPTRLYQQA
jgi:transposase